ncbi:hypothetical protein D3C76_1757650 [compost metagenome]
MTVSNYNMKENGKRTIKTYELEAIAKALGEPITSFFDENIHVKLKKEKFATSLRKEVG